MNIFAQPQLTESRTLWIGDIESWMDEHFIASIFSKQVQVVSVKLIKDKNTKMNAGYGFVEFGDHLTASHVLNTFNGAKIPGTLKTLRLNWGMFGGGLKPVSGASPAAAVATATPMATTAVSQLQQATKAPGIPADYSIYVGDLDPSVTDALLLKFFSDKYQTVVGAKVIIDPVTKYSKGYGFVKFSSFEDSQRSIRETQGNFLSGRHIKCSYGYRKTDNPAETSLMTAMTSITNNQTSSPSMANMNYYNNMYYPMYQQDGTQQIQQMADPNYLQNAGYNNYYDSQYAY